MSIEKETIAPDGWAKPIGYSNGIIATPGKILFLAGQIGWDKDQKFHSEEIAPQFEQALKNIIEILEKAGAGPEHICRMTCFCIDRPGYLAARKEIGGYWKQLIGKNFPAMSMIFVNDLLDHPAKIEIEVTAVIPD
ncbi:MAG: RidA family protein [Proteobacteria bacterium]|nr:RidA family protein [Pseudomonadota bacterium]